jgi:hypothetical protein
MKRLMLISIVLAAMAAPALAGLTLEVTANPLWTDTGIDLTVGQVVTITPDTSDVWYTAGPPVGPSGFDLNRYDLFRSFYVGSMHSSMIGYIGDDPYQGHWGDGSFFPQATGYIGVNDGVTFTASVGGSLWLGCNDDAVSEAIGDNYGSITADVNVVPVPAAVLLGVLGLGMAGLRLRRVA